MESSLSTSVSALISNYVALLPFLPVGDFRGSEAQAQNSASVLFGLENPNECRGTSKLLNLATEELTVNIWRLMRAYELAVWKLPLNKQQLEADIAFESFYDVFGNLLDKLSAEGLKLVAFEDCAYNPGDKVEVVNSENFQEDTDMIVSDMLEPIIINKISGNPVKFGKIRITSKGGQH